MASSEAESRLLNTLIVPALEKIIKNGSWRKHSKLVNQCKSVVSRLTAPVNNLSPNSPSSQSSVSGVLYDSGTNELTLAESEFVLSPLINACVSETVKIAEPALDCIQKLIAHGCLRGESDPSGGEDGKLLAKLIDSVCKCRELSDEGVELLVLKTILSAVTSMSLRIVGDSLRRQRRR
ncbi:putative mon2, dimerization and cyclophilin-binding domain-containing protein [Helianthus anomalus]